MKSSTVFYIFAVFHELVLLFLYKIDKIQRYSLAESCQDIFHTSYNMSVHAAS